MSLVIISRMLAAGLTLGQGRTTFRGMEHRPPPELEMNLQGEFVSPPRAPVANRILLWAIVVAAVASALSVAAFALWVAFMILPVALGAAAVAWLAYRYQVWRARRVMGGQRGIWRP